MIAIAVTELFAELEGAINGGSPERRARILQQVTRLFLSSKNRLDERQIAVFGDVFARLIERIEPNVLAWLSAMLSDLASAPSEVIGLLARHEEAAVAVPILQKSEILSDSDLIEIADHCGQQHLLAISRRTILGEAVTDALLKRDDVTVCRALAKNFGTRFSDQGCLKLAAAAESDACIADALARRPSMPVKMLHDLLAGATKGARARLLKAAPPRQTGESMGEVFEGDSAGEKPAALEPIDYSESKARVLALSHAGKLSDSAVNRFAVHGQRTNLVAALSQLSDVAIDIIEPSLEEGDCHGLIVACRASRLDWQTTLAVIGSRTGARRLTLEELERGKELFDSLSLSVAQRTIRFGSVCDLTKPGLTPGASTAAVAI